MLLFPTIERMASSPQGKVMTPVLCHLRYVVYLPIFLLSLLPERMKAGMVQLVLRNMRSLDTSCIPATLSLINVDCAGESVLSASYYLFTPLNDKCFSCHCIITHEVVLPSFRNLLFLINIHKMFTQVYLLANVKWTFFKLSTVMQFLGEM